MILTRFEKKAIHALANAKAQYDDANPEVGFKPRYQFVEEAAKELGLFITPEEARALLKGTHND